MIFKSVSFFSRRLEVRVIKFEDVDIYRGKLHVLENVNLSIKHGQKIVISGKSGCGKSSLLLAAMGLIPINKGRIAWTVESGEKLEPFNIRYNVAYIAQEPVMGADSVLDSILLPFTFKKNRHAKPPSGIISDLMEKVGLDIKILNRNSFALSGGQKQRVAIIRAILMGRKLFFADEVTTGLDPESREAVLKLFEDPEFTVIFISHDKELIREMRDVYQIKKRGIYKLGA